VSVYYSIVMVFYVREYYIPVASVRLNRSAEGLEEPPSDKDSNEAAGQTSRSRGLLRERREKTCSSTDVIHDFKLL
jgi:hypothetical protein